MQGVPYPKETRMKAIRLVAKLGNVAAVAREMGLTYQTVWRWTRGGRGRVSLAKGRPASVRAQAVSEYAAGDTAREVALRHNVAIRTVRAWAYDACVSRQRRHVVDHDEAVEAYRRLGTYKAAAAELGFHPSAIQRAVMGRPK